MAKQKTLRLRAYAEMQVLIAEKVTEVGGNNIGPEVDKIIKANGGVPGEPWCGDTVAYCYARAGSKSVVRAWASVPQLEKLLMKVKFQRNIARGHVVIYEFTGDNIPDHTGLFDRWLEPSDLKHHSLSGTGYFFAGEGNTGNVGAVSDSVSGGDGVKLKIRNINQVAAVCRVLR